MLGVLSGAGAVQAGRGRAGQSERVVEFTVGEESGVTGNSRAMKLQLDVAPTAAAGPVDSRTPLPSGWADVKAKGMPDYPRTNSFLSQATHNPHSILISGLIC